MDEYTGDFPDSPPDKCQKVVKKHRFTPEEDKKILRLVKKYKNNWTKIARNFEDRSARQIRERYAYFLDPTISRKPFTESEDMQLIELAAQNECKWSSIVNYFPGRTPLSLKNRWITLNRKAIKRNHLPKSKRVAVMKSFPVNFPLAYDEISTFDTVISKEDDIPDFTATSEWHNI